MERLKPIIEWRRNHSERIWSVIMTINMLYWLLAAWPQFDMWLRIAGVVIFPYAASWLWQHARLLDSIGHFQRQAEIVGSDIAAATLSAHMTRIYTKQFRK